MGQGLTPDCPRHGFPSRPSGDSLQPYHVERCTHIGQRFVVAIVGTRTRSSSVMVDYVEDRDGELAALVENVFYSSAEHTEGRAPYQDAASEAFERTVERMRAGDPPHPET